MLIFSSCQAAMPCRNTETEVRIGLKFFVFVKRKSGTFYANTSYNLEN